MQEILLNGNPIGNIKGILFDKDGTLVNSEDYLLFISKQRINESKKQLYNNGYSPSEISKIESFLYKAYGIKNNILDPNGLVAIASSKENLLSTATIFCLKNSDWTNSIKLASDTFSIASKKVALSYKGKKNQLLSGVKKILEETLKRNIKIGIISNDTRCGIKQFIKDNKLENQISYFWSSEDFPPKPNPESVFNICRLMELDASECALIGDSNFDMQLARKSGVKIALGYTGGWSQLPTLYEHHHLIHHWEDLNFQDDSKISF